MTSEQSVDNSKRRFTDKEVKYIHDEIAYQAWRPRDFYNHFREKNPDFFLMQKERGWKDNLQKVISKSPNRLIAQPHHRGALAKTFGWSPNEFSNYIKTGIRPRPMEGKVIEGVKTQAGRLNGGDENERLSKQICHKLEYRRWFPDAKKFSEICLFLARRYKVEGKLCTIGDVCYPITTLWSTTKQVESDSILDPRLDLNEPTLPISEDERQFLKEDDERQNGEDARNGLEYRMVDIRIKGEDIKVKGGLGRWYDHVLSQVSLRWELMRASMEKVSLDSDNCLPRRQNFEQSTPRDSLFNGSRRCAALATTTLVVVETNKSRLQIILPRRRPTPVQFPNFLDVAPSGMFECATGNDKTGEWSIHRNVVREFLEEILGDKDEKVPKRIFQREQLLKPKAAALERLIAEGKVKSSVTGVSVDLTSLQPSFSTIFVISADDLVELGTELNWELQKEGALRDLDDSTEDFLIQNAPQIVPTGAVSLQLGIRWLKAQGYRW